MTRKELANALKEYYGERIEFVVDYGIDGLDTVSNPDNIREDSTNYGYIIDNNDIVVSL
jgi:hypothetical protein